MPPELQAFFNTFGRFPSAGVRGEFELAAFQNQGLQGALPASAGGVGIPGAPFPTGGPGPISGAPPPAPRIGAPRRAESVFPSFSDAAQQARLRTFEPSRQPTFPSPSARRGEPGPLFSPRVGTEGGAPLPFPGGPGPISSPGAFPGGPGPLDSPPIGLPGGAPLPSTAATGAPDLPTAASGLGAADVARARLGGPRAGSGGFSFPSPAIGGGGDRAPTPQPSIASGLGGFDAGGLPGLQSGLAGDRLVQTGLEQQADVANQQKLAASVLSSLIGGLGGGLGGALGGGGGGGGIGGMLGGGGGGGGAGGIDPQLLRQLSILRASGMGRV